MNVHTKVKAKIRKQIDGVTKIDIGCGPNKQVGFFGIDKLFFPAVDLVLDVASSPLPFADGQIEEVHTSHFMEHLNAVERCYLLNELYRVMKPGAKMAMIVPHWGSSRAYGDPTHQWPPIGEMWFHYLSKEWRANNAPHTSRENWAPGYACDFDTTWGYAMHPSLAVRNAEYQQHALNFFREGAQDIHATLIRK